MVATKSRNCPFSKIGIVHPYLVSVNNNFALFLVSASDDEHVIETGGVVYQALILIRGQNIPGPGLQQVDTSLVHSQPQVLGPVGSKGLLK